MAIAPSDGIAVEAWVRRSCREQGIRVHVTDDRVVRQVASILGCASALTVTADDCKRRLENRGWVTGHTGHRGAQEQKGAAVAPGSPI